MTEHTLALVWELLGFKYFLYSLGELWSLTWVGKNGSKALGQAMVQSSLPLLGNLEDCFRLVLSSSPHLVTVVVVSK